jgi:FtsZ-interacting cell division protein ZipA
VIDHQKDVTQKVAKAKTVLAKDELTLTAKTKTKPDVNKNESAEKAIDHQKDVTQKVAKAKTVLANDELTSKAKTKTKPDVNKNESAEKVTVISYYFGRGQVYMLFF